MVNFNALTLVALAFYSQVSIASVPQHFHKRGASVSVVYHTVTPTVWKTVTVTDGAPDSTSDEVPVSNTFAAAVSTSAATTSSKAVVQKAVTNNPVNSFTSTATSLSSVIVSSSSKTSSAAGSSSSAGSGSGSGTHSGDGTYYTPGLGACGETNTDSDKIVAISKDLYDATRVSAGGVSSLCGKTIRATYGGKSVDVKVVDRCEGCSTYSIDLSPSAFSSIADESLGRIQLTWKYAS